MFYQTETMAMLIDGSSLWTASRANGFTIDYKKLHSEFARRGRLLRCLYYTPLPDGEEYSPVRKLTDFLSYNGYVMKTAPLGDYEGAGRKARSYLHMEMAMDAISLADRVQHIVLFCADGDMVPLVAELRRRGVRTTLVGTLSNEASVSDDLRRQCDAFVEFAQLREIIEHDRAAA